jgi:hypothetical protein
MTGKTSVHIQYRSNFLKKFHLYLVETLDTESTDMRCQLCNEKRHQNTQKEVEK